MQREAVRCMRCASQFSPFLHFHLFSFFDIAIGQIYSFFSFTFSPFPHIAIGKIVSLSHFLLFLTLQLVEFVHFKIFSFFLTLQLVKSDAVKCMSAPSPITISPHHPTHCMVRGDNHRFVFQPSALSILLCIDVVF